MNIESKIPSKISIPSFIEVKTTEEQLSYLQIIPHVSSRNFKSTDIANIINKCYPTNKGKISIENKKIVIKQQTKVGFYIYINKQKRAEFYLIIPTNEKLLFLEKIHSTWELVDVKEVDSIPTLNPKCSKVALAYKKMDPLSTKVQDTKSNDFLSKQLNVLDIMQDDSESVGIFYNFNYVNNYGQLGFKTKVSRARNKIKSHKSLEKPQMNGFYVLKVLSLIVLELEESVMSFIGEIFKDNSSKNENILIIEKALGIMDENEIKGDTKEKYNSDVVSTQILLTSQAKDAYSERSNLQAVIQSFTTLDGDNELQPVHVPKNKKCSMLKSKLPIPYNLMTTKEISSFFSQPGRELIKRFGLIANTVHEENVPTELQSGYLSIGKNHKTNTDAYLNSNLDIDNGLTLIGKQGSGKSEFLKKYAFDASNHGDCVVVLDFIASNDLGNSIINVLNPEKTVVLDLAKRHHLQSIAYNELFYTDDMDELKIMDIIGEKTQYSAQLIDALNSDKALTSAMRRFFISASNVTYAYNQFASFKDIIDCLELYDTRMHFISNIPSKIKSYLEGDIKELLKLNAKYTSGDEKGLDNGETVESKIDRILDRISVMRESMRTRHMFEKDPSDNIDFKDAFIKGKSIIVKMPQNLFGAHHIKNFLTLFFTTKVWIACILRESEIKKEDLKKVHLMIDEPFQTPKTLDMLINELPQMRKFRLKCVFAIQSLLQVSNINDAMKSAGFSYMLLAGADKVNYKLLAEELQPFEVEDLISLPRFYSLNLVPDKDSVLRPFVTKLPPPIKNTKTKKDKH